MKTTAYISALATTMLLAGATGLFAQAPPADSLTLDKAIAIAMTSSPAIRQATSALEASQARTRQLESAYYPQIEADATYRRVDPTISVEFPVNGELRPFSFFPNDNYEAAITAQQTLYDFGRARAQEELARSGERTARDNQEQIRTAIAFQTVQAFNTSLLMQRNLAVLDEQIAALEENLRLSEEKLKGGTATNYDVLSTQVRLTTVRNQRVDVEGSLRKQEATLRRLLGYAPSAPLPLKGSFDASPATPVPDTLAAEALRQRSEIILARDAAEAARLQLDVARTSDNPLLSLNVTGGVKNGFPPDLNAPKVNWAGTVHLAVPIFNGFHTRSLEEEAQANLSAAEARQADLEGNVTMEVEQAVADMRTNAQKITTVDLQVEQARQALALARVRYQNGVITSLELINAQTTVQEAEFLRLQYQYNYAMSRFALQRALGEKIW